MKKVASLIAVICTVAAGHVFAQSAASKLSRELRKAGQDSTRVGEQVGGKISKLPTGTSYRATPLGAAAQGATTQTLNTNTNDIKLSGDQCGGASFTGAETATIAEANMAGIGSGTCITQKFDQNTAKTAIRVLNAGVQALKASGEKSVSGTAAAKTVATAMASKISQELGVSFGEAVSRVQQLCNNHCDVTSEKVCAAATTL